MSCFTNTPAVICHSLCPLGQPTAVSVAWTLGAWLEAASSRPPGILKLEGRAFTRGDPAQEQKAGRVKGGPGVHIPAGGERPGEAASRLAQTPRRLQEGTMAWAPAGIHSDGVLHQSIIEGLATMTEEDMHRLLSDWQAWETLTEQLGLGREEVKTLYYVVVRELMRREEWSTPPGSLTQEEMLFLQAFPWRKQQLEETVRELQGLAAQVDATHQRLTKTSLVASSSGAVSAVMTLLGVALAPVTTGGSLLLTAAGQGLGVAAAATNILTGVLDNRSHSAARDRAGRLVGLSVVPEAGTEAETQGGMPSSKAVFIQRCVDALGSLRKLRAFRMAQANPGFMARVRDFVGTRPMPFWRAAGASRAAGAPALALTRGARLLSVAGAGFLLMQDLRSIRENWRHLEEGAKSETAQELRALAQELERELEQQTQRYRMTIQRLNQEGGRRARPPRTAERADQVLAAGGLAVERWQLARPAPAEAKCKSSTGNRSACDGLPGAGARRPQKYQGADKICKRSDTQWGQTGFEFKET